MKYVLGVDGGNTKTHYFLYDESGRYINHLRAGSCSHEKLGSFEASKVEIALQTDNLVDITGINKKDIVFSVFGLAGADFDWQKIELNNIIASLGFKDFIVDNDGYLALAAGSTDGIGVCSINGTGAVTVGINGQKERLQVGGIGRISGDYAGGYFLAEYGIAAVYNELYRCGSKTVLKELLFNEFKITRDEEFLRIITDAFRDNEKRAVRTVNILIETASACKDQTINNILTEIGNTSGLAVSGCLNKLGFKNLVEIILAGSIWVKGNYTVMLEAFHKTIKEKYSGGIIIKKLSVPPAAGAIIWALNECGVKFDKDALINDLIARNAD